MSLDISFPGSQHVYGLPERATSFALKPTPGRLGAGQVVVVAVVVTEVVVEGWLGHCWDK